MPPASSAVPVKRVAWSTAADEELVRLYAAHGARWRLIARQLQVTEDAARNRFIRAHGRAYTRGPSGDAAHRRGARTPWTLREDVRLLALAPRLDAAHDAPLPGATLTARKVALAAAFPLRQVKTIMQRLTRLQMTYVRTSQAVGAVLRELTRITEEDAEGESNFCA